MFGSSQPQQNTGFSFGQPNAAANASIMPKPAFSFGSSSTPATPSTPATGNTGFSFGSKPTTSTATAPSTGFSFGPKPASTTTTPATSTGFSFGAKPATTTTTTTPSIGLSLTTPNTTANTTQPTGFSFGNNNATTTTTTPNTLTQSTAPSVPSFNSQPSFAWSKPASTSTSLTPSTNNVQPIQPTQSLQTTAITTTNNASTNANLKDYTPTINDKLIKIKTSWDSTNPQCKMITHLYNRVDNTFNDFTRPANETPEEWENAMKNRPKEYNSIPVKCCGFNDLFERNKLQDNHVKQTRKLLNEINDKLIKLNEKHDLHSNNLLLKCKLKQKNLNLKLLKIAINLSILKYKGYPLTNDEELLISNFNTLLSKLDDPLGLNRVNEIWARLSSLKDKYSNNNIETDNVVTNADDKEDNDTVIKNLVKVLSKQQQGIQFLCELMEEDEKKLASLAK